MELYGISHSLKINRTPQPKPKRCETLQRKVVQPTRNDQRTLAKSPTSDVILPHTNLSLNTPTCQAKVQTDVRVARNWRRPPTLNQVTNMTLPAEWPVFAEICTASFVFHFATFRVVSSSFASSSFSLPGMRLVLLKHLVGHQDFHYGDRARGLSGEALELHEDWWKRSGSRRKARRGGEGVLDAQCASDDGKPWQEAPRGSCKQTMSAASSRRETPLNFMISS